ncbi:hypothetical protein [Thiococcus pfennigii]|uniref:hypothetical protein n=1 Tax=Thiococcus pfennigii TaxID=1057 RepID=UPI001F5B69C0|nr:hypothetical protein [Thiococcus pfennigii]
MRGHIDDISLYLGRDQSIAAAYASGGYALKAIGNPFGLPYARVSRIVSAAEEAKGECGHRRLRSVDVMCLDMTKQRSTSGRSARR